MSIEEYQEKEKRLEEIAFILEEMAKEENADISKVVSLRDEAKELAKELKQYLKNTFNMKS